MKAVRQFFFCGDVYNALAYESGSNPNESLTIQNEIYSAI